MYGLLLGAAAPSLYWGVAQLRGTPDSSILGTSAAALVLAGDTAQLCPCALDQNPALVSAESQLAIFNPIMIPKLLHHISRIPRTIIPLTICIPTTNFNFQASKI